MEGVRGGDKCYASVLLEGLPADWFDGLSEATKGDVLNPGVTVLQESCCDKDGKKAILKTSCPSTSEHRVQPGGFFPGMKATVIYKESSTLTLTLQEPSCVEILARTATHFGMQCQQRGREFVIAGNLDLLMDFRKAFDKEVLAHGASGSAEGASTAPNVLDEHISASAVGGVSAMGGASAVGDAGLSQHPFPSSEFDSSGGLSIDALTILAKVPEGRIPGLHYAAGEGMVYIRKDMRDDVISKFQNAYQGVLGKKMKAELVHLPVKCLESDVTKMLEEFNARYSNCDFSLVKDPLSVRILSNSSRQFETAKKLLIDQLQCLPLYIIPLPGGRALTLKRADIVAEDVDVIVNAANGSLKHGGGVALAIDRASNGTVQHYSNAHMRKCNNKDLKVSAVVPTLAGGSLKCEHVLHAVGPTSSHHSCEKMLSLLMRNILNEAKKMKVKSIAIPAISSGIFGVDKNLVARCIIESLVQYDYPKNPSLISDIRVVIIDQPTYQCFVSLMQKKGLLPPLMVKKTSSACKLESSAEMDRFSGNGSGEKAEAMEHSSEVSSDPLASRDNSELASFLQLLAPIASKWKVFAATLSLPEDIILRISALPDDRARLEQVIRQWWHSNLTIGQKDRLEILLAALGNSDVGAGDVAAEVWKVHSAPYPTEVPPITDETSDVDPQGSNKSTNDPSTPYGTPTSDIDMGAMTDMAKLEAAVTMSETTNTAVTAVAGAVMTSYGRSLSNSASDPSGSSADRHLIPEHLPDGGSGGSHEWPNDSPHSDNPGSMPEAPPGFTNTGFPAGSHGPQATSEPQATDFGTHGSQANGHGSVSDHKSQTAASGQHSAGNWPQTAPPGQYHPQTAGNWPQTAPPGQYHPQTAVNWPQTAPPGHPQTAGNWAQIAASSSHGPHTTASVSYGSQASAVAADRGSNTSKDATHVTSSSKSPKLAEMAPVATAQPPKNECAICLESCRDHVTTSCGHGYCQGCIMKWLSNHSSCPVCQKVLKPLKGNQPPGGTMTYGIFSQALPGYRHSGTIVITYQIPDGIQSPAHPNPGKRFKGTHRTAYLPDNKEGREVLQLLQRAFNAGLTFTVGTSHTTGQSDVVVWNDIHHKTTAGAGSFGYPDPDYFRRVKEELAAKGIVQ